MTNEAYVTGRSKERALYALREIIIAEETEPIIDMYERASWMSGATQAETSTVSCKARADRDELRGLAADIKAIVAESNTSHNKLAAEVRALGMMNRALEESR